MAPAVAALVAVLGLAAAGLVPVAVVTVEMAALATAAAWAKAAAETAVAVDTVAAGLAAVDTVVLAAVVLAAAVGLAAGLVAVVTAAAETVVAKPTTGTISILRTIEMTGWLFDVAQFADSGKSGARNAGSRVACKPKQFIQRPGHRDITAQSIMRRFTAAPHAARFSGWQSAVADMHLPIIQAMHPM